MMLDYFLKHSTTELVAVAHDPDVIATQKPLVIAHAKLALLEVEEKHLIRLVSIRVDRATDEDIRHAQQRLSIRKGTQTGWYLLEAREARDEVQRLTVSYQAAVTSAKERLSAAGLVHLKPLTQELADILHEAQTVAVKIEDLCQEIGHGGVEKPEHPFPVLLPGESVEWQLDLARRKGLWK